MNGVKFNKVAIVGAGAIGGWMGVHLARAGAQLSVLARGDTLQALQKNGLQLHQGGELHAVPAMVSNDAAALGVQDLVVISVKAPALTSAAQQTSPLIGPNTVVLTAMNGVPWWFLQGFGGPVQGQSLVTVDPQGAIARAIPAAHIMGGVVHASCSVDAPDRG
jgi:2-dehydropantoate 2-reductase